MDSVLQDVRYATRRLCASPGFTLAVVATLAIGIGGTAATFSVVDAAILRPLPFPDSDRIVRVRAVTPREQPFSVSIPDYQDYARRMRTLSAIGAMQPLELTLTGAGDPAQLQGAAVTASIFSILGIHPAHGRLFAADEENAASPPAIVVISQALWRQRFGGDPSTVGRVVSIDGRPSTIVGVLPGTARFPPGDLWIPLRLSSAADRTDRWLEVIGRVGPDASLTAVADESAAVAAALAAEHPELQGWSARVEPIEGWIVGAGLRRMVWILLAAVGMLLALACANIAGLLMARGGSRRTEMAMRAALGAGRLRLVRQLITENLLFAAIGGALGLLTASWILAAFSALLADLLPLGRVAGIDGRVIAVTVAVIMGATIGFGLLPAVHAARTDVQSTLGAGGPRTTPAGRRWSGLLVGVQIALAMVLLVGSCLLMRSFVRLSQVETGFEAANVLSVPISLPDRKYPEEARPAFFEGALAALASIPGVESAAATATNPFRQWGYANDVTPEDRAASTPQSGLMQAGWRSVTPGFFETLGIPVLRGRTFTAADRKGAVGVVVISRSLADRLWPHETALGRRLYWGGTTGRTREVVGVVGDIRDVKLDAPPMPMLYLPYGQLPLANMTLLVSARPDAPGVPDAIRRAIHALDANMPVSEIAPLERNRAAAISAPRFRTILLSIFGGAALLLAAVGLYGVVALTVVQQTREIAIRVALGARPQQVMGLFLRRGLALSAMGGCAGVFLAWAAAGVLQTLLFETDPRDPLMFAAAAGLLLALTLLATYLPARRAARLDPRVGLTRA
jgi:predicted permease